MGLLPAFGIVLGVGPRGIMAGRSPPQELVTLNEGVGAVVGRRRGENGRSKKDLAQKRVPSGGTTAQAICADSASHVAMTIETLWRFGGVRVGVVRVERAAQ